LVTIDAEQLCVWMNLFSN